jgi:hypothetical protein
MKPYFMHRFAGYGTVLCKCKVSCLGNYGSHDYFLWRIGCGCNSIYQWQSGRKIRCNGNDNNNIGVLVFLMIVAFVNKRKHIQKNLE